MKKFLLITSITVVLLATFTACGKITVTWLDGDGSLLYSEQIKSDEAIPQKPLPENSDVWDYIEWKTTAENKNITYTAVREARDRYEWRDVDGDILRKESVKGGSEKPQFELPSDTDKFDYTEWKQSTEDGVTVYTAFGYSGKTVRWKDVDGTVLYTAFVKDGENIPERYLPNDTIDWHYTEWKEASGGFVAVRVAKEKVHWLDADGTELYTDGIIPGETVKIREFPKNSKKWIYKEWSEITEAGGEKTYIAVADMNPDYFKGNVFQIMAKDIYGTPIKLGSGFVFNKSGWFITNYHVIEDAVSAEAIFEIENYQTGDSYTSLDITHAYYSSREKDIFIGRIEDYKTISSHYQSIPFVREYRVGDDVYTVGYPSAAIKMEIHSGKVVDESERKVNSLYEKLTGGSTYIPTTAYCAPGSSGGILVNEKLEVVGVVTGRLEENKKFVLSAAIKTFNFQNMANSANTKNAKGFVEYFYPDEADVIRFFTLGETHENCIGLFEDRIGVYYQYLFTEEHGNGNFAAAINVYENGMVVCTRTYAWDVGHVCTSVLSGYYNGKVSSIDSFKFALAYVWPSGNGFTVESDRINYSSDKDKSLKDYKTGTIGNTVFEAGYMDVAREQFNDTYTLLRDFFNSVK